MPDLYRSDETGQYFIELCSTDGNILISVDKIDSILEPGPNPPENETVMVNLSHGRAYEVAATMAQMKTLLGMCRRNRS